MSISREQITQALRAVFDPELGMSVVDLGLVYGMEIDAGRVSITMTLTAQGCPLHESIAEWVRRAIRKIPGVEDVQVAVTFDPPWTPDRIVRDLRHSSVGSRCLIRGVVATPSVGNRPHPFDIAAARAASVHPAPALQSDPEEHESTSKEAGR